MFAVKITSIHVCYSEYNLYAYRKKRQTGVKEGKEKERETDNEGKSEKSEREKEGEREESCFKENEKGRKIKADREKESVCVREK